MDAIWLGFSIGQFTDHLSLYSSQLAFFLRLITSQNQKLILCKFRINLFSLLICFIHNRDRYSLFLKIFEILFRYKYFIPSGILKFLFFYLLRLKIFCLDSKKLCFQPQQQIFGYQDHRIFFFLTHPNTHLKNTIVCSVIRKFLRQFFGTEKKKGAAFFREGGKKADLFFYAEKDPVRSGCGACLIKNRQLQCAGERQVFRCKNRKSAA